MINPWKSVSTKKEAEKISGILYPDILPLFLPSGMNPEAYYCMSGLIEVRYRSGDDTLVIRKTNQDIDRLSGDYTIYPAVYDCELNGTILRCRGTDDRINTAEFDSFGGQVSFSMNIGCPGKGMTPDELSALAEQFL